METLKQSGFPEHLSDATRVQIATELMEKELQKLLPSANPAAISHDVQRWWKSPANFSMSELIDFWDSADAIIGGIKLKSITALITAANYQWTAEQIPLKDAVLLSRLEQLNSLPGLGNDLALSSIAVALNNDAAAKAEQLKIIETYSQNSRQNSYKIIARQNQNGQFMIQDGNRRALLALLQGGTDISAWVYRDNGLRPKGYWVPISEMLGLVKIYRHNRENKELVSHLRAVLVYYFQESSAAIAAYNHRILGWNVKGAAELAEGLL